MPKETENPEVQVMIAYALLSSRFYYFSLSIVLFLYCLIIPLLSQLSIVPSHTMGSTGLLTLLIRLLLSQTLIVLPSCCTRPLYCP